MLISYIKTLVQDKYGQVATATFNRFLAVAVQEYSRYNPVVAETTVTTIADTTVYSLEDVDDIIGIKDVRYYPGGALEIQTGLYPEPRYSGSSSDNYHLWSQRIIDDIESNEHIKALSANVHYRRGSNEIKLGVNPGAGDTIYLTYYASHALNEDATEYETIPDSDAIILRDLVIAELYESRQLAIMLQPDYREGQESETFSKMGEGLSAVVAELRGRVALKYGSGSIDVGP